MPYSSENVIIPISILPFARSFNDLSILFSSILIVSSKIPSFFRISSAASVVIHPSIFSRTSLSAPHKAAHKANASILPSAYLECVLYIVQPSFESLPIWPTRSIDLKPFSMHISIVSPIKLLHLTHLSTAIPRLSLKKSWP